MKSAIALTGRRAFAKAMTSGLGRRLAYIAADRAGYWYWLGASGDNAEAWGIRDAEILSRKRDIEQAMQGGLTDGLG